MACETLLHLKRAEQLGEHVAVTDPITGEPCARNPDWHSRRPGGLSGTMDDLAF
jgi:hypothetical protein